MAEGDYEYEVMRCELLGLPPPERRPDPPPKSEDESDEYAQDNVDEARLETDKEIELTGEELQNASGGLDELNSILSVTQKKLNKFKVVCGSLTNLLKIKGLGNRNDESGCSNSDSQAASDNDDPTDRECQENALEPVKADEAEPAAKPTTRKSGNQDLDMSAMMGSQIDKLDTLLTKAERAELSMTHQNKQMKDYLKK